MHKTHQFPAGQFTKRIKYTYIGIEMDYLSQHNLTKVSEKLTEGRNTLTASTAALPRCLYPKTRSIHEASVLVTYSDSRACLWMSVKRRALFRHQHGSTTLLTNSPFCFVPKLKPASQQICCGHNTGQIFWNLKTICIYSSICTII